MLFRGLTVSPLAGNEVVQSPLFENLGHCYHIAYGNIVSLLASVSNRDHKVIPHPKAWSEPFRSLREAKEEPSSVCAERRFASRSGGRRRIQPPLRVRGSRGRASAIFDGDV